MIEAAFVSDEGEYAWRKADIVPALEAIAEGGQAVLGGDILVVEDGKLVELVPGIAAKMPLWQTDLRLPGESWPDYCRRTCEQSINAIKENRFERELEEKAGSLVFYYPHCSGENDPQYYIPRTKMDVERAALAVKAGYPAVAPILPDLLEWLQDMNWPVAQVLEPFLTSIGAPLIPHIRKIFATDDHIWKRWIISTIMTQAREVAEAYRSDLERIAYSPTEEEIEDGLNEDALDILKQYGWEKGV